jgi:hypothetical protein
MQSSGGCGIGARRDWLLARVARRWRSLCGAAAGGLVGGVACVTRWLAPTLGRASERSSRGRVGWQRASGWDGRTALGRGAGGGASEKEVDRESRGDWG